MRFFYLKKLVLARMFCIFPKCLKGKCVDGVCGGKGVEMPVLPLLLCYLVVFIDIYIYEYGVGV